MLRIAWLDRPKTSPRILKLFLFLIRNLNVESVYILVFPEKCRIIEHIMSQIATNC